MAMGNDRLSALPDAFLCSHILPKLSLRDAIRCSLLSRRWRSLWTLLPHLNFSSHFIRTRIDAAGNGEDRNKRRKQAIDSILLYHSAQLETFKISLSVFTWDSGLDERSKISKWSWKWIRCAAFKRVKQITLTDTYRIYNHLDVPTSLFSCDRLTCLNITRFKIRELPSYFCGLPHLVTCSLSLIDTNDDILEQLVAKSPLLENLTVTNCRGLRNLKIFAVNLTYINFTGGMKISSMRVNSPKLQTIILNRCPSMSRLELNSRRDVHLSTTEHKVFQELEGLSTISSLKKITIHEFSEPLPPLMLGNFSYLEELCIESKCFKEAEAISLILPLENLKNVHVNVSEFEEEKISLIGCLLRSATLLQTMTLTLPDCFQYVHELNFLQQLLGLKRSSGEASVFVTEKNGECSKCTTSDSEAGTSSESE